MSGLTIVAVDIGIFTGITSSGPLPTTLAREVETRGFESLFVPEHTHIPVHFDTPTPDGGPIPREYARIFDPFISLSGAASVTTTLRLGTAVCLVAQRDPIILAKEVASLDVLSGGRIELGVGVGWLREEMRNHGTDPRSRVALVTERLQAMRRIWTEDEAEFHGEHVDFDHIRSWPKPLQQPNPPILLGGWGPSTFRRVAEGADGWLAPTDLDVARLATGIEELRMTGARNGRDDLNIVATTFSPTVEQLEHYAEIGVTRTLLGFMPSLDRTATLDTLDTLDTYAELVASASTGKA